MYYKVYGGDTANIDFLNCDNIDKFKSCFLNIKTDLDIFPK